MEGSGEFLHQELCSRVAMGLKNHMNLAETALPRRGQCSADLRGMMPVVIDDGHTVRGANRLKSAINAIEVLQRFANSFHWHIQPHSNGNRCGCVLDIVLTRNAQVEFAELSAAITDPKTAHDSIVLARTAANIRDAEIGSLARSVGTNPPLHRGQEPPQMV